MSLFQYYLLRRMGEQADSLIQRTSSMTAIGHIQLSILLNDYMCDMGRFVLGGTR